jgi:hypothetical protein
MNKLPYLERSRFSKIKHNIKVIKYIEYAIMWLSYRNLVISCPYRNPLKNNRILLTSWVG